jgi:uncharacterized membrane protein HdeD (DUF308 family)
MELGANGRRRWIGVLAISLALLMLVAGLSVLKPLLQGFALVWYWVLCLVITGLALILALLEMRDLQQRTRQEHRDLLEDTLKEIQDDAKNRRQRRPKKVRGQ